MGIRLTKRLVDALEPGGQDTYFFDASVSGFGLKMTPLGRKVYLVQYRFGGRKRRFTIGPHGSPWTVEKAREEAQRLLGLVADGVDPAEEKAQAKKAMTVAQLCDLYFAEGVATLKPRTVAVDWGRAVHHVKPLLGHKRADLVTRADVERTMRAVADGKTAIDGGSRHRIGAPITGGTGAANRVVALLSAIFAFAENQGLREGNPARGIPKYKERKIERFLSGEELARLGQAIQETEAEGVNPVAVAAVRLLLFSGMRRGEVLGLQWPHVDFQRAALRLPDSKTGAKVVHLGAPALELLAGLPRIEGNPYCFPGALPGRPLVGLPKVWARIQERAGLRDVRIHDLRHGFASVGVAAGMGLPIVGALLGHTQVCTTQRYAHLSADPLKVAADRISSTIAAHLNSGTKPAGEVVPLKQAR